MSRWQGRSARNAHSAGSPSGRSTSTHRKRVSLTANYEYYVRFFSPHMLGRDSSGAAVVVGYQYAGGRRGGLPSAGDWACFYLAGLSNVACNADTWAAGQVAGE